MLVQVLTDDLYIRFALVILAAVLLGYLVGALSRRAGELDSTPKCNIIAQQPLDYAKEQ
jgi:hypothetical protein